MKGGQTVENVETSITNLLSQKKLNIKDVYCTIADNCATMNAVIDKKFKVNCLAHIFHNSFKHAISSAFGRDNKSPEIVCVLKHFGANFREIWKGARLVLFLPESQSPYLLISQEDLEKTAAN